MSRKPSYDSLVLDPTTALIENPSARIPICLVVDASYSMSSIVRGLKSTRMDQLNEGVRQFHQELLEDDTAKNAAEISIVAFADEAQIIQPFGPLSPAAADGTNSIEYTHQGTSLGSGVKLALDQIKQRKKEYQAAGVDYYQPWIVVLTDGCPTDSTHKDLTYEISEMVQNRRLTVFPIGIDVNHRGLEELKYISGGRAALKLHDTKFKELFAWLSQSVTAVSQSAPGDSVPLDTDAISTWASL